MVVGALGGLLLIGGLIWAFSGLPAFGHYDHRYGRLVARESVPERAATNSVNVTAFDYRGIDTLGEEFILFVSVVAVVVLLRRLRDERQLEEQAGNGSAGGPEAGDAYAEGEGAASRAPASPLQRWFGLALGPPLMLLAAYVITHGQLTPGGGFQGGVVLMAALAVVFVAGEYTSAQGDALLHGYRDARVGWRRGLRGARLRRTHRQRRLLPELHRQGNERAADGRVHPDRESRRGNRGRRGRC